MASPKSTNTDADKVRSLLDVAQRLVIHIRQAPNQNISFDISALEDNDDADRPDPLRVPEIIIVVCVLLLWCASIFIFIRHSELLRIRHRDLPFRSAIKPAINPIYTPTVHRTSDVTNYSKGQASPNSAVASPMLNHQTDVVTTDETVATSIQFSVPKRRRHTRSFDFHPSSLSAKRAFFKGQDKERLLDPLQISSAVRESLLDLHQKSMENISSTKSPTSYSTNDMSARHPDDGLHLLSKKRCIQESPV